MKPCIVNVSCDHWYPRGQDRLKASLGKVGYDGETLFFRNKFPTNSPPHAKVPYAFKIYAIMEAINRGHKLLLWCDSSMVAVANPAPLFYKIEESGHFFVSEAQKLGNWSTDAFLKHWGLTRDEAMEIPLFSAGFTGLNIDNPRSKEFLDTWLKASQDGVSFIGPWGRSESISLDERCKGHRHDMSAGSLIAHKLNMELQSTHSGFIRGEIENIPADKRDGIYFEAHGM